MPDLKLILMVWEVFTLWVSLLCYFVSSCTFFLHPVVTQTDRGSYTRISSDTLNQASHSGSSGWVSTSCIKFSFWYQPAQSGAPAMKLSCCFIQTDSSAPNSVCLQSRCNPSLKLANFPDSQNRITSPMAFSTHPCFHHLSFQTLLLSVFVSISLSSHLPSVFCLSAASLLSLHLSSPPVTSCQSSRDSLSCCDGRGLWDTSCSFNDFAPRHRSAREIQLPFFNRMGTLTRATPLWNMCEFGYACAQTSKLVLISHLSDRFGI